MLSAAEITGGNAKVIVGKTTLVVDGKVAEEKKSSVYKIRIVKNKKRGDYTASCVNEEGKPVEGTTSKEFLTKEQAEALKPEDFLPKAEKKVKGDRKRSSSVDDQVIKVLTSTFKCRKGTTREGLMLSIVAANGKPVKTVMGTQVGKVKLGIADINHAVQNGYIKLEAA